MSKARSTSRIAALLLLLAGSALALAAAGEEPTSRIVFEDARWRVVENSYPPSSETGLHTHRWPRAVYVIEGGVLELIDADGAARRVEVAAGQSIAAEPEIHRVRNPGTTTVRLLETETKPRAELPSYAFTGGRWFDGESFVERTLYSVGGLFTDVRPERIDELIVLGGLFVVPPFGDAHAHHFDSPPIFPAINATYLAEGIFYGISMNNTVSGKRAVLELAGRPETVDVAWADVGVTATLGHPIMVYETLARRSYDFDRTKVERALDPQAQGDAYVILDNRDDLAAKWDQVVDGGPDLVKIYLLYSEQFEERRGWTETYGDRGLDPALAPAIVDRAHQDGLRVAAHVETAADFRLAVASGVDIVAHLPGYSPDPELGLDRYRLTAEDARRAAEGGVVVIPTPLSSAAQRFEEDNPEFLAQVRKLHKDSIGALADAGVELAIGADSYGASASQDAFLLDELGLFSNLELLKMWSEATPRLAFPDRRIGKLEPGYEASFLALSSDPLLDFEAVRTIEVRFKEGRPVGEGDRDGEPGR